MYMEKWFVQPVPGERRESGGARMRGRGMNGTWRWSREVKGQRSEVRSQKSEVKGQIRKLKKQAQLAARGCKCFIAFIVSCEVARGLWKGFMTDENVHPAAGASPPSSPRADHS